MLHGGVPGWTMKGAILREIDRGLSVTAACKDFRERRKAFDSIYSGAGTPYAISSASGALSGGSAIPEEWIRQVDCATTLNRYTNSQRTLRQTSDGLYQDYRARLARMKSFAAEMEAAG
jgi:hypothetical protein